MSIRFGTRKSKGPGPLTLAMLLIAAVIVASNVRRLQPVTQYFLGVPATSLTSKAIHKSQSVASEPINSALIDAIVSIVQAYYVDGSRVDNRHLIGGAMRSLAYAIPDLRYEESETELKLHVRNEFLALPRSQDTSYEELMTQLKAFAGFCAKTKVGDLLTPASMAVLGSETNASTIVLNAMLSALDAHSSLMSPESYRELKQGTEGSFGGLGVLVGVKDHLLTVLKPMPRSPALRVGLRKNDRIVSIDGFQTFGLSLDQLVGHMRGEPGSSAQLAILRPDANAPWNVSVPREVIEVDSVEAHPKHIGDLHFLHLVIDSFASRTGKEVSDAIRQFRKNNPLHGVVLDLRSNPGGLLDQAIAVSDIFLKSGVIVSTKGRRDEVERATNGYDEVDFPVVVLMNEDSASASEIVAGALQDNGRAVIVGQPSFGKGSVQTLFELPEDRALKLTIARYYTPSNRSIQNVGITPDVWVQPVLSGTENLNLFGSYRYRSEAFLPNHLSTASALNTSSNAQIKGYYLSSSRKKTESEKESDVEFKIAQTIISKVHKLYGGVLPEGARRSSHVLALAVPEIRSALALQSQEVQKWLKEKMSIDWGSATGVARPSLAIDIPEADLSGRIGSKISIPWKVSNIGPSTANNVSIFFQAPMIGLETQEILVGTVAVGRTVTGVASVYLHPQLLEGKQRISAGAAVDAIALESVAKDFTLDISEGEFTSIQVSSEFQDGSDSREPNAVDENEHGIVRIHLKNTGKTTASKVSVSLSNLSGKQLKLVQTQWDIPRIAAGQELNLDIPIIGGSRITSPNLTLGAIVSSKDLKDSTAKLVELKSTGTMTAARDFNAVSH